MTIDEKMIKELNNNLNEMKYLLQQSIAIQLYTAGATQDEIAKNLGVSKTTVNKMVKGMKIKKKEN